MRAATWAVTRYGRAPERTPGASGVSVSLDSYAKVAKRDDFNISQNHTEVDRGGAAIAAATDVTAVEVEAPPTLGAREGAYRAIFWRAYLGTRVYGVYDALRAAAVAGGVVDDKAAAMAGQRDVRALAGMIERLEAEGLARRPPGGGPWALEVLRVLPPLTRAQAEALPRALRLAHLDFLGLTPGFSLPAWWKRVEPSFAPAAAEVWGWSGESDRAAAPPPVSPIAPAGY